MYLLVTVVQTWWPIVFIQPGVQDMSIIICSYKIQIQIQIQKCLLYLL